ncbi:hypothetical protein [Bacillus wiedmannii]|uniref:hypothetical protein n=1 Tax=Bacillus wiedmannii TaxID=1890302 RepID=UPI0015CF3BA1|nr:hypothetical protein [Bacillus wiedmannii]
MTNKEMEKAIEWIKHYKGNKKDDEYILGLLLEAEYTETEIRYCYVLATGKNMI